MTSLFFNKPNKSPLLVQVCESIDVDYSCYLWPSAICLSNFLWRHSSSLFGSSTSRILEYVPKFNSVLELGCGVGLPGILCGKLGALKVVMSDRSVACESVCKGIKENSLPNCNFMELDWFSFPEEIEANLLSQYKQEPFDIDVFVGSDLFYDPPDFEVLIALISLILSKSKPTAVFLTCYQDRSSKRCVESLLSKWNLSMQGIPLEFYEWDDKVSMVKSSIKSLHSPEMWSMRLFVIKFNRA